MAKSARRRTPPVGRSLRRRFTVAGLSATLAVGIFVASREETPTGPPPAEVAVYGFEVVRAYPHDPTAFTQGLVYLDGFLYEGTGLNGASTLRRVRLETGEVLERVSLGEQHFGEGITDWGDRILQLTWRSQLGFVYERATLEVIRTFQYQGEAWGLTHDRSTLIMSDGTSRLRFFDPVTFEEVGTVAVRDGASPVDRLNELEYVRGEVYANVWQTDRVAIITPTTGQVRGWVDLKGLPGERERTNPDAVLNGIAYDAQGDRLFVTGKLWPTLFEIKLVRR